MRALLLAAFCRHCQLRRRIGDGNDDNQIAFSGKPIHLALHSGIRYSPDRAALTLQMELQLLCDQHRASGADDEDAICLTDILHDLHNGAGLNIFDRPGAFDIAFLQNFIDQKRLFLRFCCRSQLDAHFCQTCIAAFPNCAGNRGHGAIGMLCNFGNGQIPDDCFVGIDIVHNHFFRFRQFIFNTAS